MLLIKNLYEENLTRVCIDSDDSPSFKIERGVRQGCILSPGLFNFYGEYIKRRGLDRWEGGIAISSNKISNLRYGRTTLVAASELKMTELLHRVESESNKLDPNRQKTKIMIIDHSNLLQRTGALDNLETVEEFVYLSSLITSNDSCEAEIRRKMAMGKSAVSRLIRIWKIHN